MAGSPVLLVFKDPIPGLVQKGKRTWRKAPRIIEINKFVFRVKRLFFHNVQFTSESELWAQPRAVAVSTASNAICIMQDGMDQSKFRVPRSRTATSKLLSSLFRPQLHIAGCLVHGKRLLLSVSDEDCKKDAAAQLEQLSRSLEMVWEEHQKLPDGLCVQSDNTYREGKNRHVIAYYIILVCLGCFRWCMCSYLRVGHSD